LLFLCGLGEDWGRLESPELPMPSQDTEGVANILRLTQLWLNGWRHKRVAPSASTRWLMEQAAARLGTRAPASDYDEFDWVSRTFSETSAMTLYVAARGLADRGQREDALAVLGDACRAQTGSSGPSPLRLPPSARADTSLSR
jgi:hypothetical protein